jgi:hypothetical protein
VGRTEIMTESERSFLTAKGEGVLRELLANLRRDYRELTALTEQGGDAGVIDLRRQYAEMIREVGLFAKEFGIEEAND